MLNTLLNAFSGPGGVFMVVITALGAFSVAVAIERGVLLLWRWRSPQDVVEARLRRGALAEAAAATAGTPETLRLAARLLRFTHADTPGAPDAVRKYVRFGASPRGVQAMVLAGKVRALATRGDARQPVLSPEDIVAVAVDCLRHRVLLNFDGESGGIDPASLVREAAEAATRSFRGR